jgi:hypothetical protein
VNAVPQKSRIFADVLFDSPTLIVLDWKKLVIGEEPKEVSKVCR